MTGRARTGGGLRASGSEGLAGPARAQIERSPLFKSISAPSSEARKR